MAKTILEGTKETIEERLSWVKNELKTELVLKEALPQEVLDMEFGSVSASEFCGKYMVYLYAPYFPNDEGNVAKLQWVNQMKTLLTDILGLDWGKIQCYSSGTLYWVAEYKNNITFQISDAPKPPLCKLVKKEEFKTITTYEAVCPEDAIV